MKQEKIKKEKIKKEVMFKCNSCLKQTEFIKEKIRVNPFPYSDGWIFVYNIQIKVLNQSINIKNKHFCCKRCFDIYILEQIKLIKERSKK